MHTLFGITLVLYLLKLSAGKGFCRLALIKSILYRMRSHRLLRLDDVTRVIVECRDFLATSLMKVVLTTCNKFANIMLH